MTDTDNANIALFWDRLEDVNAGMLGAYEHARPVPMSHYADKELGSLWFLTARGTDLAKAASKPVAADYFIASASDKLYCHIRGELVQNNDRAKLEELWNLVAASWFDGGKDDPDLCLLELRLTDAEVWVTGGGLSFIVQMAKANITGDKPDMGDHFSLRFAS